MAEWQKMSTANLSLKVVIEGGGQGSRMLDQVDRNMSGVVLPILIIHPNVCCMRAIPLAGTLLGVFLGKRPMNCDS